jgi:16S rRNA (guanine1207-N2)-methyltransferase
MLPPAGTLWLVANRHLPYGTVLTESFHEVDDIGGDGAFRLVRAARPVRARR